MYIFIFEILKEKRCFLKKILLNTHHNKYQKKILACAENKPKNILVSLDIYANQNPQKAHPNIHKIAKNIPIYHLLSKCENWVFFNESNIQETIRKKAQIYQSIDNFSWYIWYDKIRTTRLSKDNIKVAIAAGRNLKEYTKLKKYIAPESQNKRLHIMTSKVTSEKSMKNKKGVCKRSKTKLRKKFNQSTQEVLECFANKISLMI